MDVTTKSKQELKILKIKIENEINIARYIIQNDLTDIYYSDSWAYNLIELNENLKKIDQHLNDKE